jgi:hypothetical protein
MKAAGTESGFSRAFVPVRILPYIFRKASLFSNMKQRLMNSFPVRRFSLGCFLLLFLISSNPLLAEEAGGKDADVSRRGVFMDELGIGSGYAWGKLKRRTDAYKVVPAFVRIGFNMNSLFGLEGGRGTLQFALEPFANAVVGPEGGMETGLDVFVRYLHPLTPSVQLVSEIGAGPMYFSLDTREQGDAGFNFLDQFGLGLQAAVSENMALTL